MADIPEHPHQKVHAFLRSHHMGVLSTVSSEGRPWGSAIYFVSDEDFTFYFVTRAETYKYQNLEADPYVALTVADEASQTTVQLAGKISPLPFDEYVDIVFHKMAKLRPKGDNDWMPPVEKIHKGDFMPLVITPSKLQYANYKQFKTDPRADYIEHILPA